MCSTDAADCVPEGSEFLICPNCALHFRKRYPPLPPAESWEQGHYTKTERLKNHLERRSAFVPMAEIITKAVGKPGTVLDVGCGVGIFLEIMKEHGWGIAGIEPASTPARIARENLGTVVTQGDFMVMDVGPQYDVLTLVDVMRHVEQPAAFLERAVSALKPGGYCVIRDSNAEIRKKHRLRAKPIPERIGFYYMQEWSPAGFTRSLSSLGCDKVRVYPSPMFIDGTEPLWKKMSKRPFYSVAVSISRLTGKVISPNQLVIARKSPTA